MRSAKRHGGVSLEGMMEHNPAWQPSSGERSPEEQALTAELSREISAAIAGLPPDQRAVLVLADIQSLTYEEAAEAAGCSLGTVKSRLSRARARVRDYFANRRELLPGGIRLD